VSGKVFGLGIGPGDPELITLKALRLLRTAPVLAYPAPEQGESLARSIVAEYLTGEQHEIGQRATMWTAPTPPHWKALCAAAWLRHKRFDADQQQTVEALWRLLAPLDAG
jgi:precorrin-2 methylase